MVAQIAASLAASGETGLAASRERLRDYLLAAGRSNSDADQMILALWQEKGDAADQGALSLPSLLLAVQTRAMQGPPPAATPALAPLPMPTRDIPLRSLFGFVRGFFGRSGQPFQT